MVFVRACVIFLAFPLGLWADEARFRFVWEGANGYGVTGAMAFDTTKTDRIVRETDMICFVIEGVQDGDVIGRWALTELLPDTSWRLHFDQVLSRFIVHGEGVDMPQAWNMNGAGNNCGPDGFGLNIGNLAQDLCLDDGLVVASQADPRQPFAAVRDDALRFPPGACHAPDLLSGSATRGGA